MGCKRFARVLFIFKGGTRCASPELMPISGYRQPSPTSTAVKIKVANFMFGLFRKKNFFKNSLCINIMIMCQKVNRLANNNSG